MRLAFLDISLFFLSLDFHELYSSVVHYSGL